MSNLTKRETPPTHEEWLEELAYWGNKAKQLRREAAQRGFHDRNKTDNMIVY